MIVHLHPSRFAALPLTLVLATVGSLGTLAASPEPDPDGASVAYTLELLDATGAESVSATTITADGTTVGGSAVVRIDDVLHTVGSMWGPDGTRVDVLPAKGLSAGVNAFGADGTAVGYTTDAEGQDYPIHPAVLVDGAWQVLPSLDPPQQFGWAVGVGADGTIVGVAVDADEDTSAPWRSRDGATEPLGSLGGESGYATGVSPDGTRVVGWSQASADPWISRGYVLPIDGSLPEDATVIEGLGGDTTFARGLDASGQVTGDAADGEGLTHAFLWSEEDGIRIIHSPAEGTSFVLARAIGADGTVVGAEPTAEGPWSAWRWSPTDGVARLDDLVALPEGWHVRDAWAMADDGTIVVAVHDETDAAQAAVLRPLTVVSDTAHLDVLSIAYDDSGLRLGIDHADHPGLLDPATTVIEVPEASRTRLGDAPQLPFLAPAGASVWNLDGGWTVRGVTEGELRDDLVTIHLERVAGPGIVAVWRFGVDGPEVAFTSLEPVPQALSVDHDAHAHRTWSFTEPGGYTVDLRVSAVTAADAALDSGTKRYRFVVAPDAPPSGARLSRARQATAGARLGRVGQR